MPRKPSPFPELRRRFGAAEDRAQKYQVEGLPIPTGQLAMEFDEAVRAGDVARAEAVVKRAETLLARADQDWGWLKELLQRVDGLRGIADTVGLDLARIDTRVGNPRGQLLSEPLTPASIEKAAAGASFALAVLNDALPKYVVKEAQALGVSIRRARDRGEDVREAVVAFSTLLRSLQDPALSISAERLVEARRAVARIPRAPSVAAVSQDEEDEILSEARNLARRLHRIKTRAHDATDAVRLMSQVRNALAEDRRYVSPEEEVELLWAEVARLTEEKRLATGGPPLEEGEAGDAEEAGETDEESDEPESGDEDEEETTAAPAPPVPRPLSGARPSAPSPLTRSRLPMPIVPPVSPLPDEGPGAPPQQSPDSLAEGAGPRVPRPTRIAIAAAYVPPDLAGAPEPTASPPDDEAAPEAEPGVLPPPGGGSAPRRGRSRHRDT